MAVAAVVAGQRWKARVLDRFALAGGWTGRKRWREGRKLGGWREDGQQVLRASPAGGPSLARGAPIGRDYQR